MRSITIDPVELLERGDAMFADEPFDAIVFEDPDGTDWDPARTAAELGARAWMSRIETISVPLYRALGEGELLAMLLANAASLVSLRLSHPSSVAGIADLALPALASVLVYCEGSSDGDGALAALARRPRRLRELQIVGCGITEAAACTIASAKWPLTYLAFGGTHYETDVLGTRGAMALAKAASLSSLRTLDVVATSIDDASLEVLVASPHLHAVQQLSIAENIGITDAGIERFAKSSAFRQLRELGLYQTSVTDRGLACLAEERPDIDVGAHRFTRWSG
jgi:hypothetical protein